MDNGCIHKRTTRRICRQQQRVREEGKTCEASVRTNASLFARSIESSIAVSATIPASKAPASTRCSINHLLSSTSRSNDSDDAVAPHLVDWGSGIRDRPCAAKPCSVSQCVVSSVENMVSARMGKKESRVDG